MRTNVYEIVNNRIIELLELGTIPWRKSWTEDELKTEQEVLARFPVTPSDRSEYARTLLRFGRREAAISEYR